MAQPHILPPTESSNARDLFGWMELRHGGIKRDWGTPISSDTLRNNHHIYVTYGTKGDNRDVDLNHIYQLALPHLRQWIRVDFNNQLPPDENHEMINYFAPRRFLALLNRNQPPVTPAPDPRPRVSSASWESAARGWLAGAVMFVLVIILAKLVDKYVVSKIIKMRNRRRTSQQWSSPESSPRNLDEPDFESSGIENTTVGISEDYEVSDCPPPPYDLYAKDKTLPDTPPPSYKDIVAYKNECSGVVIYNRRYDLSSENSLDLATNSEMPSTSSVAAEELPLNNDDGGTQDIKTNEDNSNDKTPNDDTKNHEEASNNIKSDDIDSKNTNDDPTEVKVNNGCNENNDINPQV